MTRFERTNVTEDIVNEGVGCPRHSVSLVRQIASGDELVAHFRCPERDCTVSAPQVGCLWCGKELEVVDVSVKTDAGLWSAILRCPEHGRWWWQQHARDMRKLDDGEPGRVVKLRPPGLAVHDGDLIIKPATATGPDGTTTFFAIAEWPLMRMVAGPVDGEDYAVEKAKALSERAGVRLWRDRVESSKENDLVGPIF